MARRTVSITGIPELVLPGENQVGRASVVHQEVSSNIVGFTIAGKKCTLCGNEIG